MEFSRQGYWRSLSFLTPGDRSRVSCVSSNEPPGKSIRKHACVHAQSLSHVWYFETPWTVACQTPLPMEFSRQEYWRGLPFPNPGLEDIHTLKLQVFPNSSPCNIPLGVAYSKLSFLKSHVLSLLCWLEPPNSHFLSCNILSFESQRPKSYWCSESQYKCPRYPEATAASSNSLIFHLYVSQGIYHTLFCITIIYRYVRSQLSNRFFFLN